MAEEYVYFKRNVPYVVGVRFHLMDTTGFTLTNTTPWVAVEKSKLRDFKMANKRAFVEGLIIEIPEPSVEYTTYNSLDDEAIDELFKNYLKLKNALTNINSVPILGKMLERAKETNKSSKIVNLIQTRLDEYSEEEEIIHPSEMQGVS